MDGLTRSSSAGRLSNLPAAASVAAGATAVLALPAGVAAARFSERVDLVRGLGGAVVAGVLLGLVALVLAARGRERIQRTLGRSGGGGTARTGRALALLALFLALTGALALGFFGLLELFADS